MNADHAARGRVRSVGGSKEDESGGTDDSDNDGPCQMSTLQPEQQEQGNKGEEGLKQIGADITLESWVDDLKGHQAKKPNLIP